MIKINGPFIINSLRQLGDTIKTQIKITSSLLAHLSNITNSGMHSTFYHNRGKSTGGSGHFTPTSGTTSSANLAKGANETLNPGKKDQASQTPIELVTQLKPLLKDLQLRPEIATVKQEGSTYSTTPPRPLSSEMIDRLEQIIKEDRQSFDTTEWRPRSYTTASGTDSLRKAPAPPLAPKPVIKQGQNIASGDTKERLSNSILIKNCIQPGTTASLVKQLEAKLKSHSLSQGSAGSRTHSANPTTKPQTLLAASTVFIPQQEHSITHNKSSSGITQSPLSNQNTGRRTESKKSPVASHQAMVDELTLAFKNLRNNSRS